MNIKAEIIGRLCNKAENVRLAYLEGMIDYNKIIGKDDEQTEFIIELYNYLLEHTETEYINDKFILKVKHDSIMDFVKKYEKENGKDE